MYGFIMVVHIIACVALICIVLLQAGKGASISGLFGGGSSNEAVFGGPTTPAVVKKITAGAALVFMITTLMLTAMGSRSRVSSLVEKIPVSQPAQQPESPQPK